jgi:hypothetical protein
VQQATGTTPGCLGSLAYFGYYAVNSQGYSLALYLPFQVADIAADLGTLAA